MGVARCGFLIAAVVLVYLSGGRATNPGFRIVIASKGLDYLQKVGIPILEKALSQTSIPDINGKAGTPIGDVKYSLSNIKLGPLSIATSSLTSGSNGITLSASGISISGTADWSYDHSSFPHISDHGSADVSVGSTSLSVSAILGSDSGGHFTVSASQCSISIGHLDVHFHGGASWLYNLFSSNIADAFKGSMQSQLCSVAKNEINQDGNKEVESFPIVVKIDEYAQANYALVAAPVFSTSFVETNHKGEFQSVSSPAESSLSPSALPDPSASDKMLYIWFTDYVANTAGEVYQKAGAIKYTLTPDKIPANLPIKLNTYTFQDLIPQLYKAYPNKSMVLDLSGSKPPTMDITTKTVNLTVPLFVNASVMDTNATKRVFTLQVVIYCDVKVGVATVGGKEMLTGNATLLKAEISLVSSAIGQFSVTKLQNFADLLSSGVVIPQINAFLNKGIEIPSFSGVSFVDAAITLGDRYVMVSTDVNYTPSSMVALNENINEL